MKQFLFILAWLIFFSAPAWGASYNLNWVDNSTNEDGFRVHRRLGDTGVFEIVGTSKDEAHMDITPDDLRYCYKVNAFNAGGVSGFSNIACTPPISIPVPAAPSGLTITIIIVAPTP